MDFPTLSSHRRLFLSEATEAYYENLRSDLGAQEYLKSRGITGGAAQHFRLGAVGPPLPGHEGMVGMLSIPYITPTGVSAIRFRRLHGDGPKYHQETGSFSPLFNVRDLHRPEPYIAVCEGEFDAIVMSELVGVPAVAISGVGQWSKRGRFYARLLQDYDKVFIVMDPDEKGQEVVPAIMKAVANPVNVVLPEDVNDTFLAKGKELILEELGLWESCEMPLSA